MISLQIDHNDSVCDNQCHLCDELFLEIFSFLGLRNILNIMNACDRFHQLCITYDAYPWPKLFMDRLRRILAKDASYSQTIVKMMLLMMHNMLLIRNTPNMLMKKLSTYENEIIVDYEPHDYKALLRIFPPIEASDDVQKWTLVRDLYENQMWFCIDQLLDGLKLSMLTGDYEESYCPNTCAYCTGDTLMTHQYESSNVSICLSCYLNDWHKCTRCKTYMHLPHNILPVSTMCEECNAFIESHTQIKCSLCNLLTSRCNLHQINSYCSKCGYFLRVCDQCPTSLVRRKCSSCDHQLPIECNECIGTTSRYVCSICDSEVCSDCAIDTTNDGEHMCKKCVNQQMNATCMHWNIEDTCIHCRIMSGTGYVDMCNSVYTHRDCGTFQGTVYDQTFDNIRRINLRSPNRTKYNRSSCQKRSKRMKKLKRSRRVKKRKQLMRSICNRTY